MDTTKTTLSSPPHNDGSRNLCANCCQPLDDEQQEIVREIKIVSSDNSSNPLIWLPEDDAHLTFVHITSPQNGSSPSKEGQDQNNFVQVHTALSSIYKLDYLTDHHHHHQDMDIVDQDLDQELSELCPPCALTLTDLYKSYKKFNQLRQLDSALAKRIDKLDKIMRETLTEKLHSSKTMKQQQLSSSKSSERKKLNKRLISEKVKDNLTCPDFGVNGSSNLRPSVNLRRLTPSEVGAACRRPVTQNRRRLCRTTKMETGSKSKVVEVNPPPSSTLDIAFESREDDNAENIIKVEAEDDHDDNGFKVKEEDDNSWNGESADEQDDSNSKDSSKKDAPLSPSAKSIDLLNLKPKRRRAPKIRSSTMTCPLCSSSFESPADVVRHLMKFHTESRIQCPICPARKFGRGLFHHVQKHVGDRRQTCAMCPLTFFTRPCLEIHAENHWRENGKIECPHQNCPHSSPTSRWSCASVEEMKKHCQDFHRVAHRCLICGTAHKSAPALQTHSKTEHPGVTPWQCHLCLKYFKCAKGHKKHLILHDSKPLLCQCGLRWPREEEGFYKSHVKTCDGVKRAICPICRQVFGEHRALYSHLTVHKEAFPCNIFSCHLCPDKAFPSETVLQRHVKDNHDPTGKNVRRPHKCDQCPKAFATTEKLRVHFRVHTGERPFLCTTCGKTFAKAFTLRQHLRIHAKEDATAT